MSTRSRKIITIYKIINIFLCTFTFYTHFFLIYTNIMFTNINKNLFSPIKTDTVPAKCNKIRPLY